MIRAIAAIDDVRGIGKLGETPWRIPAELHYFRQHTEHATVLMGMATYEQFATSLVNRRNLVASRQPRQLRPGFELISDVVTFLDTVNEDVWIIGGAELYATTLEHCQELYLTRVVGDFNCDRFFPDYADSFRRVGASALQVQNGYQFTYEVYERIKNR